MAAHTIGRQKCQGETQTSAPPTGRANSGRHSSQRQTGRRVMFGSLVMAWLGIMWAYVYVRPGLRRTK